MTKTRLATVLAPLADLLLLPLAVLAAPVLAAVRRLGLHRARMCRRMLLWIGVLPVRRHYYEPFVDPAWLRLPLDEERWLPGIEWNVQEQLQLLDGLRYEGELGYITGPKKSSLDFRLGNGAFESGDAEFLYQLVRKMKPKQIVEIGSGNSTLLVRDAIERNRAESPAYTCRHSCIEPYEAPWLESAGVTVLRKRVEEAPRELFAGLESGDLLFIDSSHVIRPQGDVLTEYLQILPALRKGVIVHVHDIFSPRDYPQEWVAQRLWLWNEQYLLEAFLSENRAWKILAALNLLKNRHFEALKRVCPYLTPEREPGSFYMQKIA